MTENIKQIAGVVSEETNAAIDDYAKSKGLKKMIFIGNVLTNFIQEETEIGNSKESSKKETGSKKRKEVV
ncbi:MAG: hypothetical protein IPO06_08970 [Leptospiraceae bacterium]|nr:hypothetical protein [Leptospiraceae bacterium]